MKLSSLFAASVAVISFASVASAADISMPRPSAPVVWEPVAPVAPNSPAAFSWTGGYIGVQGLYNFRRSLFTSTIDKEEGALSYEPVTSKDKKLFDLSDLAGGLYAGYNLQMDNGLVLGLETDFAVGKKRAMQLHADGVAASESGTDSDAELQAFGKKFLPDDTKLSEFVTSVKYTDDTIKTADQEDGDPVNRLASGAISFLANVTPNWSGATRIRLGVATNGVMPYVAGGIAYSSVSIGAQESLKLEVKPGTPKEGQAFKPFDAKKPFFNSDATNDLGTGKANTIFGYTLGAGVDFAVNTNMLVRLEYRYTDYLEKQIHLYAVGSDGTVRPSSQKMALSNHDVRLGVAFKF